MSQFATCLSKGLESSACHSLRKQTCCKYGSRDNRVVLALACWQLQGQRTEGNEIQGCYNDSLNLTAFGRRPDGKQRTACIHVYSGRRHDRRQNKRAKRISTTALPLDKNASKPREPLLMLVRRPVTYAMDLTGELRKNLNRILQNCHKSVGGKRDQVKVFKQKFQSVCALS